PARRRAPAAAVAFRALADATESPGLRSALGSDPGSRPHHESALGAGFARVLRRTGFDGALGDGDDLLRPARIHASHHGWRLRTLPQPQVHPDGVRMRVGAGGDAPAGLEVPGWGGG